MKKKTKANIYGLGRKINCYAMKTMKLIYLIIFIIFCNFVYAEDYETERIFGIETIKVACTEDVVEGPLKYTNTYPLDFDKLQIIDEKPEIDDSTFNKMFEFGSNIPLRISIEDLFTMAEREPDSKFEMSDLSKFTWYYGDYTKGVIVELWQGCVQKVLITWADADKFALLLRYNKMKPIKK